MAKSGNQAVAEEPSTQRLDKWLWYARVAKTRTLASSFVSAGKVRVNRIKTEKPGASVKVGDVITIAAHSKVRVLRILAAGTRRGPAAEAALLFEDLTPPPEPKALSASRPQVHQGGRPAKKDRRDFEAARRRYRFSD